MYTNARPNSHSRTFSREMRKVSKEAKINGDKQRKPGEGHTHRYRTRGSKTTWRHSTISNNNSIVKHLLVAAAAATAGCRWYRWMRFLRASAFVRVLELYLKSNFVCSNARCTHSMFPTAWHWILRKKEKLKENFALLCAHTEKADPVSVCLSSHTKQRQQQP